MVLDHIHYFQSSPVLVPEWTSLCWHDYPHRCFCSARWRFGRTHDRKRYFLRIWAIATAMGIGRMHIVIVTPVCCVMATAHQLKTLFTKNFRSQSSQNIKKALAWLFRSPFQFKPQGPRTGCCQDPSISRFASIAFCRAFPKDSGRAPIGSAIVGPPVAVHHHALHRLCGQSITDIAACPPALQTPLICSVCASIFFTSGCALVQIWAAVNIFVLSLAQILLYAWISTLQMFTLLRWFSARLPDVAMERRRRQTSLPALMRQDAH